MLSSDFHSNLEKFQGIKKHFMGVFSADTVPKRVKKNSFIICNTDVSSGLGQHWYCAIKRNNNTFECFDSLGIDPDKKIFLEKHFNHAGVKKIVFNVTQVQSSSSDTCGFFVLYFIIQRFYNLDMSFADLLNEIFELSTEKNEENVKSFCNFHLK